MVTPLAQEARLRSLSSIVSERQYRILELTYGHGWTQREISGYLKISIDTIQRDITDARDVVLAEGGALIEDDFGKF